MDITIEESPLMTVYITHEHEAQDEALELSSHQESAQDILHHDSLVPTMAISTTNEPSISEQTSKE